MPTHWATDDLKNIDFNVIRYYLAKGQRPSRTWEEVPEDVKKHLKDLESRNRKESFLQVSKLSLTVRQRIPA